MGKTITTTRLVLTVAASAVAAILAADTSSVEAPAIGYIARRATVAAAGRLQHAPGEASPIELRAMWGVPGAARFSDPLPLPKGTRTAEAAPGLGWVLLTGSSGASAYQPGTQTTNALPFAGLAAAWTFSPSGGRVALYDANQGQVALISGLPGSPVLDSTIKVAPIDSFAVGDQGSFVYTSGNRVFSAAGQLLYAASGSLGPVVFEAGREAIVLFDGGLASLMEVATGSSNAAPRTIAAALANCDRLFAGADKIYAGDSVAGVLSIVDFAGGSVTERTVRVTRIVPTGVAGTMVVSTEAGEPAWLVNAQGVSFVPASTREPAVAVQ